MNDEGFTLIEVIVWIAVMAVIALVSTNLLKLQLDSAKEVRISRFYDEVELIDRYFGHGGEADYNNKTLKVDGISLENSQAGAVLNLGQAGRQTFKYIEEFEIREIKEIHVVDDELIKFDDDDDDDNDDDDDDDDDEDDERNHYHEIQIDGLITLIINPKPPKNDRDLWFKEVMTYGFE